MVRKKLSDDELKEKEEEQKLRAKVSRSARSGKITKQEGKVSKSTAKTKTPRSQKKIATVRKSRN